MATSSSLCPVNNIPQQTQQSNFIGTNQFADLIISNFIVNKIGDVMKNDFQLSAINICKLLVLLSTTELKHYTSVLMGHILTTMKDSPRLFWEFIFMINKYRFKKKQITINPISTIVPIIKKTKTVEIDTELNFMIALYNHITKNPGKCSYKKTLDKINIRNTKETIFIENFSNIFIKMKNCELKFNTDIAFNLNVSTGHIVGIRIMNQEMKTNQIKTYLELLEPEQAKIIAHVRDHMLTEKGLKLNECEKFWKMIHSKGYDAIPKDDFSERSITELICQNYPYFNQYQTMLEIVIVTSIIYSYFGITPINIEFDYLRRCSKSLYDPYHTYEKQSHRTNSMSMQTCDAWSNRMSNEIYSYLSELKYSIDIIRSTFESFTGKFDRARNQSTQNQGEIESNSIVSITLSSINDINENEIMQKFINKIYKSYKKNNDRIKIHSLQLEEKIVIKEEPNPDYADWEEKKKLLEQIKNNNGQQTTPEIIAFLAQPIPPRNIKTETRQKVVVVKQLNEIEKDMDTLFLRDLDKRKLMNSLTQFKSHSDLLKDVGVQNKLNILLHGLPGTGKSTTIQAVATYLQRDIYYVDLQKAELNEDLQLIFEYVNKNIPNSGIVVIEDIDAMTDVVLKRNFERVEYKVSDLIKNQRSKLSLEYLLNILQGTLTLDGSIFMVTTNHLDHLDEAFYRDGRFDVKLELKLCDHHQIKSIYKKMMNRDIPNELLQQIPENKYTPATIIYHIKTYIFDIDATDQEILSQLITIIE